MDQKKRNIIGIVVLAVCVLAVAGVEALRRYLPAAPQSAAPGQATRVVTLLPGSVPVYVEGQLAAGFSPDDLQQLKLVSFIEPVEGKTEEGWMLRDVLRLYLSSGQLTPDSQVIVSSSSKSAQLTWAEVDAEENMVMFDLSGRGTLKLVSKLEKLDTREEWVQDVEKIEVKLKGNTP